ncbi:MAG: MBL fold metallo-hydrolase [bacterium]|nr:MBL fold metallo-hydrolase [bacterium]
MKLLRPALLILFIMLVTYLCFEIAREYSAQSQRSVLRITLCDVGQADAILIQWQSTQVLVDGGRDEKVLKCLWSELPFLDSTLELVVGTHPDADHIGGLPLVFDQFLVTSLLLPPVSKETADFAALRTSVSREKELMGRVVKARSGQTVQISDEIRLSVLAPLAKNEPHTAQLENSSETALSAAQGFFPASKGEVNDWSIVLLLEFNEFSALLTGDASERVELALLQVGLLKDIDVLKVGHHGSKSSTADAFLDAISPETSLISVGENNPYGHPNTVVLEKLQKRGVQILRSDQLGSVTIESDGERYWIVP